MNTVPAVNGSLNALKNLSKDNKIIIITSRTNQEMIAAKKWLKNNKVEYDKLINTSNKSKTEACRKNGVDVLIEDELAKLEDVRYRKIRKILLQRPYNEDKKAYSNIIICRNWDTILKVLMLPTDHLNQILK